MVKTDKKSSSVILCYSDISIGDVIQRVYPPSLLYAVLKKYSISELYNTVEVIRVKKDKKGYVSFGKNHFIGSRKDSGRLSGFYIKVGKW